MKEMRIVGWTPGKSVVYQEREITGIWKEDLWVQECISEKEFETYMQGNFPTYWNDFLDYYEHFDVTSCEYFWNYGETDEMKRNGDAFVYTH